MERYEALDSEYAAQLIADDEELLTHACASAGVRNAKEMSKTLARIAAVADAVIARRRYDFEHKRIGVEWLDSPSLYLQAASSTPDEGGLDSYLFNGGDGDFALSATRSRLAKVAPLVLLSSVECARDRRMIFDGRYVTFDRTYQDTIFDVASHNLRRFTESKAPLLRQYTDRRRRRVRFETPLGNNVIKTLFFGGGERVPLPVSLQKIADGQVDQIRPFTQSTVDAKLFRIQNELGVGNVEERHKYRAKAVAKFRQHTGFNEIDTQFPGPNTFFRKDIDVLHQIIAKTSPHDTESVRRSTIDELNEVSGLEKSKLESSIATVIGGDDIGKSYTQYKDLTNVIVFTKDVIAAFKKIVDSVNGINFTTDAITLFKPGKKFYAVKEEFARQKGLYVYPTIRLARLGALSGSYDMLLLYILLRFRATPKNTEKTGVFYTQQGYVKAMEDVISIAMVCLGRDWYIPRDSLGEGRLSDYIQTFGLYYNPSSGLPTLDAKFLVDDELDKKAANSATAVTYDDVAVPPGSVPLLVTDSALLSQYLFAAKEVITPGNAIRRRSNLWLLTKMTMFPFFNEVTTQIVKTAAIYTTFSIIHHFIIDYFGVANPLAVVNQVVGSALTVDSLVPGIRQGVSRAWRDYFHPPMQRVPGSYEVPARMDAMAVRLRRIYGVPEGVDVIPVYKDSVDFVEGLMPGNATSDAWNRLFTFIPTLSREQDRVAMVKGVIKTFEDNTEARKADTNMLKIVHEQIEKTAITVKSDVDAMVNRCLTRISNTSLLFANRIARVSFASDVARVASMYEMTQFKNSSVLRPLQHSTLWSELEEHPYSVVQSLNAMKDAIESALNDFANTTLKTGRPTTSKYDANVRKYGITALRIMGAHSTSAVVPILGGLALLTKLTRKELKECTPRENVTKVVIEEGSWIKDPVYGEKKVRYFPDTKEPLGGRNLATDPIVDFIHASYGLGCEVSHPTLQITHILFSRDNNSTWADAILLDVDFTSRSARAHELASYYLNRYSGKVLKDKNTDTFLVPLTVHNVSKDFTEWQYAVGIDVDKGLYPKNSYQPGFIVETMYTHYERRRLKEIGDVVTPTPAYSATRLAGTFTPLAKLGFLVFSSLPALTSSMSRNANYNFHYDATKPWLQPNLGYYVKEATRQLCKSGWDVSMPLQSMDFAGFVIGKYFSTAVVSQIIGAGPVVETGVVIVFAGVYYGLRKGLAKHAHRVLRRYQTDLSFNPQGGDWMNSTVLSLGEMIRNRPSVFFHWLFATGAGVALTGWETWALYGSITASVGPATGITAAFKALFTTAKPPEEATSAIVSLLGNLTRTAAQSTAKALLPSINIPFYDLISNATTDVFTGRDAFLPFNVLLQNFSSDLYTALKCIVALASVWYIISRLREGKYGAAFLHFVGSHISSSFHHMLEQLKLSAGSPTPDELKVNADFVRGFVLRSDSEAPKMSFAGLVRGPGDV